MLIFGGIILDKMGVRFTGLGACFLMVIGAWHQILRYFGFFPIGRTNFWY